MLKVGIGAAALASVLLSSAAWAQDKIKVGVTATLEGTYTLLGVDGVRGFKVALKTLRRQVGEMAARSSNLSSLRPMRRRTRRCAQCAS